MSNFLVWLGVSLIIRCLNSQGFVVGDESLMFIWKMFGVVAATIDIIKAVRTIAEEE